MPEVCRMRFSNARFLTPPRLPLTKSIPSSRLGLSGEGHVSVMALDEVRKLPEWKRSFTHRAKDWRYYEIVQETINPEFDYLYMVIRGTDGKVLSIQPFFLL